MAWSGPEDFSQPLSTVDGAFRAQTFNPTQKSRLSGSLWRIVDAGIGIVTDTGTGGVYAGTRIETPNSDRR